MSDTLRDELRSTRERLLSSIVQPELGHIRERAARRRRRRRALLAGVAILAVLGVGSVVTEPPPPAPPRPEQAVPDLPTPAQLDWSDAGITLHWRSWVVRDLPGDIRAIEYTDAAHGFLLAVDCAGDCGVTFAATADGGATWELRPTPAGASRYLPDRLPRLLTFGNRVMLAAAERVRHYSDDDGRTWHTDRGSHAYVPAPVIAPGGQLSAPPGCHGLLAAQTAADPLPVPLAAQPAMDACWAARAPAADGAWWVGGRVGLRPAVGVSRDDGRSWSVTELPATELPATALAGAEVRVATLGSRVYAVVMAGGQIAAVLRSDDRGATFTRTGGVRPFGVAGDPLPLLDGRLLIIGTDGGWYLSPDGGATFQRAGGLKTAREVRRTAAGYVAYGLFGGEWCAFSPDGWTWWKLTVV